MKGCQPRSQAKYLLYTALEGRPPAEEFDISTIIIIVIWRVTLQIRLNDEYIM